MAHLEAHAQVRWSGYRGEVRGASGALAAEASAQTELGGPGEGTNPEELLAAAQANCFTSTLASLARARNVQIDAVETSVTTRLEWSDGRGDHNLVAAALSVRVASNAPWDVVEDVVREAERDCPVCRALAGNVELRVELDRLPPAGSPR